MTHRSRLWLGLTGLLLLGVAWILALPDYISPLDESAFRAVNDLPNWIEYPGWPIMQVGSIFAVPLVVVACIAVFRDGRVPIRVALAGGSAWLVTKWLKVIADRARPDAFLTGIHLRPQWSGLGFPSGHSAVAFAIAVVLGSSIRGKWRATAWAIAVVVGLLRVYTAAHFPLDVIGGWGLGLIIGSVAAMPDSARHPEGATSNT